LAVKVTTPHQIEVLGSQGTPLWDLLESGIPLLPNEAPRLALPAPGSPPRGRKAPPRRQLSQERARDRANNQLQSAETLLACGQFSDSVSLAFASIRSLALAWLPKDRLHGLRESELTRTFLEALPKGRRGPLARRVRFAKRLREETDLGCQEIQDPNLARQVVRETRELLETLFPSPDSTRQKADVPQEKA
jgi:hypothetical protein